MKKSPWLQTLGDEGHGSTRKNKQVREEPRKRPLGLIIAYDLQMGWVGEPKNWRYVALHGLGRVKGNSPGGENQEVMHRVKNLKT